MSNFIDLTGKKFGRLTVIKRVENSKNGSARWECKCECGKKTITLANHLKDGHTKSCGCYSKEVAKNKALNNKYFYKHGLFSDKKYVRLSHILNSMKKRCYNINNQNYKYYGGRGIKICNEWLDEENGLLNFYNWAINNGYKENLSIDRINVNGNYEPDNCRWATPKVQANNRTSNRMITYNEKTYNVTQWAEKLNMKPRVLADRIRRQWSIERAFLQPVRKKSKNKEMNKCKLK